MGNGEATLNRLLLENRDRWPGGLSERQYSVLNLIAHCRTEVLGRLALACGGCGHIEVAPRSCGNRHCPLCLGARQARWAEAVCALLPEGAHFHVVFTLPEELGAAYRENFGAMTEIFFRAAGETLESFARNNWGMEAGAVAVLHTWGRTLRWHPHIHMLVPAGGFRPGRAGFRRARENYLFPVRAMSAVFRAIFLRALSGSRRVAWPAELSDPGARRAWARRLASKPWVIYSKPTMRRTRAVVRYLARYTSRTAVSNGRIHPDGDGALLDYHDHRDGRDKTMRLGLTDLFRRFAAHIAPRGLRRIRYRGYLNANSRRRAELRATRTPPAPPTAAAPKCPRCGASRWTSLGPCRRILTHEGHGIRLQQGCGAPRPPQPHRFTLPGGLSPPILVQPKDAASAGHAI